jgi:polysaccharide export outer membrane protein
MLNIRHTLLTLAITVFLNGCITVPSFNNDVSQEQVPVIQQTANNVEVTQPVRSSEDQLKELERLKKSQQNVPTLGRGDILNVSVYDEPDLTIRGIPVRPDGKISFPLVGDVQAEGLTVADLADTLTKRLAQYMLAPKVSVIVQEFNSQQYTIFGEVVKPGVYPLKTNVSITDALASAGGLNKGQFRATSVELADLTHAYIARDGQVLPVDFVKLIRQGDLRYNVSLQAGDYIYIPSGLAKEVYILGEVRKPMLFAFRENMPMSRTLAQAEGFTPDADLSRIHILRGALHNPTIIEIDFKEVLKGNAREVALQAGDVIYVPPTGLTSFSRMMSKILPTISALQGNLFTSS